MKKLIISSALTLALMFSFSSCMKDLNQKPYYDLSSAQVYEKFANYKNVLAKVYGGLAMSGQSGPSGKPDVAGIDEGFSSYVRVLFCLQEFPTDEINCVWGDPDLPNLSQGTWGATNVWTSAMYYRVFYQVALCNEFIGEMTDAKLASRNITGADAASAKQMKDEARFLRALSYYHALDMFRNVPFVDENSIATNLPKQKTASELFNWIETELKAVEATLPAAHGNEYGRADKAAVQMLLAHLYLGAKDYTGTARNADAVAYSKKVIDANAYSLEPNYADLFKADNNNSNEIIFAVNFDGNNSRTYGGTTFMTHASVGGNMVSADFGIDGGWGGLHTTKAFVNACSDSTGAFDKRTNFFTDGQSIENTVFGKYKDGYGVVKYKNITKAGAAGSNPTFVDIDFPIFRLADAYLMYAEATLRGGGSDIANSVNYINKLRERANGNTSKNIAAADLTLDFMLAERGKELHWEGYRRTDLIRFGKFTGSDYLWGWKGNVLDGASLEAYKNIFPLPASDIITNTSLVQNTGY
jgi:starch-binding outer membrane protein, SusD/RagB family